jgi:hypothetical protein
MVSADESTEVLEASHAFLNERRTTGGVRALVLDSNVRVELVYGRFFGSERTNKKASESLWRIGIRKQ